MSLRGLISASAFVIAFSGISGTAFAFDEKFSVNVDRPGNDMRNLSAKSALACQKSCGADRNCRAWTFVRPGIQGPSGGCWLKNAMPRAVENSCCTSGLIRRNL